MKCREVQDRWDALLDRAIEGAARVQVEEHLKECRLCECEYQALVAAESMLRRAALVRQPVPAGLIDRVMQRLQKTPRLILLKELAQLAAAAVLLLGIFTLAVTRYSYEPVVATVQSKFQDTRDYVTKDLPRAISSGFNAVWKEATHE